MYYFNFLMLSHRGAILISLFSINKGKYVWVGGYGCVDGYTEVYENEKWTALKPYLIYNTYNVIYHCVTFLPDVNDKFYVLGGLYNNGVSHDQVMEYDFNTNEYTQITKIKDGLAAHGCTGLVLDNGQRFLVTVGGHVNSEPTSKFLFFVSIKNRGIRETVFHAL